MAGLKNSIALPPVFLGLVHRGVRVLDQRLRIQAVVGIDAHANAGGDVKIVLVDGMRLATACSILLRRHGSIFRLRPLRKAARRIHRRPAGSPCRRRGRNHQALCDGLKKLVADRMPQGIVDVFEAIQIQKQHRDFFRVPLRQGDGLRTRSFRSMRLGRPVRKSCSAEWAICSAIARAVLTSRNTITAPVGLPCPVMDGGDGVFDRNFNSVTPDEDAVDRQMHGAVLPHGHCPSDSADDFAISRRPRFWNTSAMGRPIASCTDQPVSCSATRLRKVIFPAHVRANNRVADAVERDLGALLFREQRLFHGLALDGVAQRALQSVGIDLAFDQIILRTFLQSQ